MAFSIFFLASPRCADGVPVSLGSEAEEEPLVGRKGREVIVSRGSRFELRYEGGEIKGPDRESEERERERGSPRETVRQHKYSD